MSIFSRYMARLFLKPFVFGLGLFAVLIFLGDMFDHMHQLMRTKASLWVILQYLWLEVPYWGIRTIPMATLLATLVAITGFVQSGEWLAVQACGFEAKTFWKPLLWCALGVTALSFVAQETILPVCFHRARQLLQRRIHPEGEWDLYSDITLVVGPEQFISAKEFKPSAGRLTRPVLDTLGPDGASDLLDAKLALWDEAAQRWVFHDGIERLSDRDGVKEKPFTEKTSNLSIPPRNLVPRTADPDEMSLRELLDYSRRMRRLGVPVTPLIVAAHAKTSYPFTNVVLCALGIPIALRLRRSPKAVSFCVAMVLSFFYLWVMELAKALGASGRLPPVAAAWSANVLFVLLAVWLFRRWQAE